jgi:uncharacterized protein YebE (UPF0316 family)
MEILAVDSWFYTWIFLPFFIFFARVADQTLGSLRFIYLSKGFRFIAPILGFFEVIIWLLAVGQIINDVSNPFYLFAYGAGFAAGNYLGIIIEERLSIGYVLLRVIPKMDTTNFVNFLRANNIGVTLMDAKGSKGDVQIIMSIIRRKQLQMIVDALNNFNPKAFYTIEDIRAVSSGIIRKSTKKRMFDFRKGK